MTRTELEDLCTLMERAKVAASAAQREARQARNRADDAMEQAERAYDMLRGAIARVGKEIDSMPREQPPC
jgi:hypothetical protein